MKTPAFLLAGTLLSAFVAAGPAAAQSTGDTSPIDHVEGQPPATGETKAAGRPVETETANAPDQKPAFANQTRAPQPDAMPVVQHQAVAEGLPQLWSMEFLPDGRMLVAAKKGSMHVVSVDGKPSAALAGVPAVVSEGQAGLLDVALAPDFESSSRIFFSFSEPRDEGNGTSVASARLVFDSNGGAALEDVAVIFRQMPGYDNTKHYGSRLVFGPAGELYVTVGERSDRETRVFAQDVSSGFGKVFRIDAAGKALPDNPFVSRQGAQPEIWSYGHRNLQAAALDGQGRLWTVEHGPKGGDELNMPKAGLNYGWPEITYGVEYSGGAVGAGITAKDGMEQPAYYWDPVIGPSGMVFYTGSEYPEWNNAFLIGGLVSTGLVVVHMDGDRVSHEERIPLDARIRDVKIGPDGAVYAVTENPDEGTSSILKLARDS